MQLSFVFLTELRSSYWYNTYHNEKIKNTITPWKTTYGLGHEQFTNADHSLIHKVSSQSFKPPNMMGTFEGKWSLWKDDFLQEVRCFSLFTVVLQKFFDSRLFCRKVLLVAQKFSWLLNQREEPVYYLYFIYNFYSTNVCLPCLKSVQIRGYFWSLFSCARTEYRKIRTRNNSVFGHFSGSV